MKKILSYWKENRRVIIITFEIFWIIVFLLDMVINQASHEIPQFVYVNF